MRSVWIFVSVFVFMFSSFLHGDEDTNLHVAVIGTGFYQGEEGITASNFEGILREVKEYSPVALFFTGSLIEGLERSTAPETLARFKENLEYFSETVESVFGKALPVYPLMGNHVFPNTEVVKIFKEHFNFKEELPLEPHQFAYTVSIGRVQFVVLATGVFETKFPMGGDLFTHYMPFLDWVEKTLRTGAYDTDFRCVIGHQPAFSTRGSEGVYGGLDREGNERDRMWEMFSRSRVHAYFCSHEPLYDRSNRKGIWQVMSGGIIKEKSFTHRQAPFFEHFLVLKIPGLLNQTPSVEVIDKLGKVWDQFSLTPLDRPVHQLRISQ